MTKKVLIVSLIAVLISAGSGFIAGMKYQESKTPQFARFFQNSQSRNQFSQRVGQITGVRSVSGKLISKDKSSITIELADSSSKIILLSDSSQITKTNSGTDTDLTEGTQVTVFGQENSDGSLTAQNIQIGTILPGNQMPSENRP